MSTASAIRKVTRMTETCREVLTAANDAGTESERRELLRRFVGLNRTRCRLVVEHELQPFAAGLVG